MTTEPLAAEEADTGGMLGLAAVVAGLASLALAVTFASAPGSYVGDFRFEMAWQPGRTLTRLPQLWDETGGLGRVAGADRSPVPAALFALLRGAGLPEWAAQRIWHALLLTVAGTGCLAVVRYVAPRIGVWHVVSALAFMFSPLGLGLLLPSSIYATHAVTPWLLAATLYGLGRGEPTRWAAVFALGIFAIIPTELPGSVYAVALVPVAAAYVVMIERRSTWPRAARWTIQAGVLTTLATGWVLIRTVLGHGALLTRVEITATPEAVAMTTSWSEAFRGLGHWLTYFHIGAADPGPNFAAYLENPLVVLATFLVPTVALMALFRRKWRSGPFFVVLSAISLVVVVGLHPTDDPSPWGRLIRWVLERFPSARAFRNTMKGGAGHVLGYTVLFGAVVTAIQRRVGRWPLAGTGVVVAALGLIALASYPVWAGDLYPPRDRVDTVPSYWEDAIDWLDAQPGDGRVALLPGTSVAIYRWGGPGDDLFEALLDRPHVQSSVLVTSTPTADSLTFAIDTRLRALSLADQSLVPIMRRLGVRYVVIRNDLAWRDSAMIRPATLEPVREDPDLTLVRVFGEVGENTTGPEDRGTLGGDQARYERTLPPVEIYEIDDASRTRATRTEPDMLVAGDGEAWFGLTSLGLLDTDRAVRHVADLDDDELTASLRAGGWAVVTDTNVRRLLTTTHTSYSASAALPAVDDRPDVGALFPELESQTVSWIPDALSIEAISGFDREPWTRAEQAFDGNPASAWRTAPLQSPLGRGVEVTLRRPEPIGAVTLTAAPTPTRQVRGGYVELRDGTQLPFTLSQGRAEVDGAGRRSDLVRVVIDDADPFGQERLGFSEITIEGLDLRAARQVPTDLFTRAAADADLAETLAASPLSFAFERDHLFGNLPTEVGLRRRFLTDVSRSFTLTGRMWLSPDERRALEPESCMPWVELDGDAIPVRLTSELDPVLGTSDFESCEPVDVEGGWHLVENAAGARLDRLELSDPPTDDPAAVEPAPTIEVVDRGPSRLAVDVASSPAGTTVLSGIAYDEGWTAEVDGVEVDTVDLDTQVAVRLNGSGTQRVVFTFGPQRLYDVAVLVSVITVVACVVMASRRARPSRRPELPS